jgi:hypothetical protein
MRSKMAHTITRFAATERKKAHGSESRSPDLTSSMNSQEGSESTPSAMLTFARASPRHRALSTMRLQGAARWPQANGWGM